MQEANRRPIAVRSSGWAQASAAALARSSITPNQISCISVLFAAVGGVALLAWPGAIGLLICALCIVLRLLCNLFDGMVAVEGGRGTVTGALYNEMPDRIADSIFLVALGYAIAAPWLGWLCALLAALTAYIRTLGGALGQTQDFRGPMAKPQRMAALTILCLIAAIEPLWGGHGLVMVAGLVVIVIGTALTVTGRVTRLARALAARP